MKKKDAIYTEELLSVLRIEREAYTDMLFDEGKRYLHLYLDGDQESIRVQSEHAQYWDWWFEQADRRNRTMWFEHCLETWGKQVGKWERALLTKLFHELHAADMLSNIRPPRHVMRETIDHMRELVEVKRSKRKNNNNTRKS